MTDTAGKFIRLAVQITGIVLIVVGVVYLLDVFVRVREVINAPQKQDELVNGFAKQIDADKIAIPTSKLGEGNQFVPGDPIPIGRPIALGMALAWHLLFAWIPLAILAAGGKLIYWTLADSRHTRDAIIALAQRSGGANRERSRPLDLSGR